MTEKQEMEYLSYKMVTDLFNFHQLTQSKNFAVKSYKDSMFRGEVVDK